MSTSFPVETANTLRQPMRRRTLVLDCPDHIDFAQLDDWLENTLAIKPVKPASDQADDAASSTALEFVWRCLLLNTALLQLGNIPAFDTGCIHKVVRKEMDSSLWNADISTVSIQHIPPRAFSTAIEFAVKLLKWCVDTPRTPKNTERLYNTIEKKIKPSLQKMVVAGKSTIPVLRVAHRLNIPFMHLEAGVYQLGWGANSRRMDRSTTDADSAMGSKLSQNKVWSANLIRMAGLPAPEHGVVNSIDDAVQVARKLGWPVVVKPTDLDRGEGISVGIGNEEQLAQAFEAASKLSKSRQIIIEREVAGVCHRLFIFAGKLLYAVKRLPKSIRGNGTQTVAELIAEANRIEANSPPWLKSEHFPDDDLAVQAITAAGFSLHSIPPEGVWIPLRAIESTASGGHDEEYTERLHPDNLDVALRAASLFGLEVVGVDIISPDIEVPWHKNGAIINEVNFAPLFGGAEISRSHIPAFLHRLLANDGRIPVEVIVGDQAALAVARQRQQEFVSSGTQCFLTSHELTCNPAGQAVPYPFIGAGRRCLALLLDRRVEAIILLLQTDELLHTTMPIDQINKLTVVGKNIYSSARQGHTSSAERLVAHLKSYVC